MTRFWTQNSVLYDRIWFFELSRVFCLSLDFSSGFFMSNLIISPGKQINYAPFQVVLDWVFESRWLFALGRVATRRRGQRKLWVNVRRLRLQVDRRNLSLRVQGRSLPNLSVLVPTMSPDNQMKIHAVWPLSMSYMKCNKDLKIHSK